MPLIPFHWTLVQNIKRDPFETGGRRGSAKRDEPGRCAGWPGDRVSIRLEHAADWPAACGRRNSCPTRRSRRCRCRRPTTSTRSWRWSRRLLPKATSPTPSMNRQAGGPQGPPAFSLNSSFQLQPTRPSSGRARPPNNHETITSRESLPPRSRPRCSYQRSR